MSRMSRIPADAQRRRWCLAAAAGAWLTQTGCISMDLGGDSPGMLQWTLLDARAAPTVPLDAPLVDALLLQARPSNAVADSLSIAYSRQQNAFAFYQFAAWTERPVRQVPRLLQQRLQARGVAGTVGQVGDPMRADWLLTVGVDELYHAVQPGGGQARVALTLELFDRRQRRKLAERRFSAQLPVASEDAAGAVDALSQALALCFDRALPWLEAALPAAGSPTT
jgi:ABC-type uncharacterized transport system auxiliary subunit